MNPSSIRAKAISYLVCSCLENLALVALAVLEAGKVAANSADMVPVDTAVAVESASLVDSGVTEESVAAVESAVAGSVVAGREYAASTSTMGLSKQLVD